jgi:hypothetical protein
MTNREPRVIYQHGDKRVVSLPLTSGGTDYAFERRQRDALGAESWVTIPDHEATRMQLLTWTLAAMEQRLAELEHPLGDGAAPLVAPTRGAPRLSKGAAS